jgi:hypothetical protein
MVSNYINLVNSVLCSKDYEFFRFDYSHDIVSIISKLQQLDFFSYVEKNDYQACIEKIKKQNNIFIYETNRVVTIDPECIDEGMLLEELRIIFDLPVFKKIRFSIEKFSCYWDNYNYMVRHENLLFCLWSTEEYLYQKDIWQLPFSRLIRMVNDIMLMSNLTEQFYYNYEGTNDTKCIILSPSVVLVLERLKLMKSKSICDT